MLASDLDAAVRRDLRGLQKDTAESVARHLVAAGSLVDEDPEQALAHARYARARASRIAVVREAAGIAAYHAGEWSEALGELRAARRMGGGPGHVAVMADIERALGRPERALELARGPEVADLPPADRIELAIVAAGARRDLGELAAAVVSLQLPDLNPARRDPWSARLFYAYADNLLAAGRESDALQWFVHAHDADEEGETDAAARIAELTGEELEGDDVTFGEEEYLPDSAADAEHLDDAGEPEPGDHRGPELDDRRGGEAGGTEADGTDVLVDDERDGPTVTGEEPGSAATETLPGGDEDPAPPTDGAASVTADEPAAATGDEERGSAAEDAPPAAEADEEPAPPVDGESATAAADQPAAATDDARGGEFAHPADDVAADELSPAVAGDETAPPAADVPTVIAGEEPTASVDETSGAQAGDASEAASGEAPPTADAPNDHRQGSGSRPAVTEPGTSSGSATTGPAGAGPATTGGTHVNSANDNPSHPGPDA